MNPSSIYSKTGKGVQEASGKTSFLSRGDRAILAAIDGKTTVQQLGKKFDRAADDKFMGLLQKMDADGFIREVSPGTVQRGAANAPRPAPAGPRSIPSKPGGGAGGGEDLDFTQIFSAPPKMEKPPAAPSKPPPTPSKDPMAAAREAAEQRARAEREAKAKAEAAEKAAMMSTQQFRLDAEMRAKIEREKTMAAAAEGKTRAEIEARERAEREAKARAEAEARAKAEAEARARAEAERQAKERAEREARDKAQAAERARYEAAERARREAEELRFKIEEERRAREEAERRAREEAERSRREAEERARREAEEKKAREEAEALRQKYEEEKKAREEAERRAQEERQRREQQRLEEERKAREEYEAQQKQREEEERKEAEEHQRQIRLAREAEDRKRRDADARKKKEEEARRWEVEEARRKSDDAYRQRAEEEDRVRAEREAVEAAERAEAEKRQAAEADALAGSLLADFDSFSQRQEEDRKQKEEEERRQRAEAERRAKEEEQQRAREEAERKARKAEEKRRREEEEARAREEEEQRQREEEARRKEAEAEKKKEREAGARKPEPSDIPISSADLGMGDVQDDERKLTPEARKALRDREREVARARSRGDQSAAKAVAAYKRKQPVKWGKPVALFLFFTLLIGAGAANFVPLDAREYEKMATDALGAPVKIGAARMYVLAGVQVRFERVTVGEAVKIGQVRAVPELSALLGEDRAFSRIELEDVTLRQDALGAVLFGAMQQGRLRVARVTATRAKLEGPVALPPLDFDASVGATGKVFSVKLSGDRVNGLITPRDKDMTFEVSAASFTVPFVEPLTLTEFAMKGSADREGMTIAEFDGRAYDGTVLGNARIRWGETWSVQGDVQARAMNAAVFSPQLVSEGRLGAKGRFAMSGPAPAKLGDSASLVGDFEVAKGALGSFDLSRALQSTSAQASGRTPFSEMQGSVSLVNGALAFRDLRLSAGLLNATGTLDVDAKGALSGRVHAELRNLRGTFYLGGKLSDPQLRR